METVLDHEILVNSLILQIFFMVSYFFTWLSFLYHKKKQNMLLLSWFVLISTTTGCIFSWCLFLTLNQTISFYFRFIWLAILMCIFPYLIFQYWFRDWLSDKHEFFKNRFCKSEVIVNFWKKEFKVNLFDILGLFLFLYLIWMCFYFGLILP